MPSTLATSRDGLESRVAHPRGKEPPHDGRICTDALGDGGLAETGTLALSIQLLQEAARAEHGLLRSLVLLAPVRGVEDFLA
jgi:hypothetical protein